MTEIRVEQLGAVIDGRRIIDDVSVDFPARQWSAIIGRNGAGKTTLLRALCGLQPHTGTVTLDGIPVRRMNGKVRATTIAYAPQRPPLPVDISVREYIALGRHRAARLFAPLPVDAPEVSRALLDVDLAHLADRPLGTLSGGEQQRAALAQCIAQDAAVLFLDEPTASLDLGHQQEVLDHIDALRLERGLTVVSVLHDLNLAGQYAQHLVLMDEGRVVAAGAPGDVLTDDALATHFHVRAKVTPTPHGPLVQMIRPTA
jgi:iron complex transport system ATP-binding protein